MVQVHVFIHPGEGAAGWRSQSVSGGEKALEDEGAAVPQHPVWAKPAQRSSGEGCGVG